MGKQVDKNDFWFIEKNPITKVGVYPYLGKQISQDCEPDKIYYVLRPKEELFRKETLDSLRLIPLIDGHTMIGKDFTAPEDKGLDGTLGDNVSHDTDTIYNDLKIISNKMKEEIKNGKKELSLGYFCRYDKQPGTYKGQRYDYVQRDIIANHLALVDKGRMGADVRVYDSQNIPEGESFAMDSIDMEFAEDKDKIIEWFTAKGNHIPVLEGQTKEQALKSFIEKRQKEKEEVPELELNDTPELETKQKENQKTESIPKQPKEPTFKIIRSNSLESNGFTKLKSRSDGQAFGLFSDNTEFKGNPDTIRNRVYELVSKSKTSARELAKTLNKSDITEHKDWEPYEDTAHTISVKRRGGYGTKILGLYSPERYKKQNIIENKFEIEMDKYKHGVDYYNETAEDIKRFRDFKEKIAKAKGNIFDTNSEARKSFLRDIGYWIDEEDSNKNMIVLRAYANSNRKITLKKKLGSLQDLPFTDKEKNKIEQAILDASYKYHKNLQRKIERKEELDGDDIQEIASIMKIVDDYDLGADFECLAKFREKNNNFFNTLEDKDFQTNLWVTETLERVQYRDFDSEFKKNFAAVKNKLKNNKKITNKDIRILQKGMKLIKNEFKDEEGMQRAIDNLNKYMTQTTNDMEDINMTMDDEDIEWITVRGTHIPIKKGESKEQAVKNFLEGKRNQNNKEKEYFGSEEHKKLREQGKKAGLTEEEMNKLDDITKKISEKYEQSGSKAEPEQAEKASKKEELTEATTTTKNTSKEEMKIFVANKGFFDDRIKKPQEFKKELNKTFEEIYTDKTGRRYGEKKDRVATFKDIYEEAVKRYLNKDKGTQDSMEYKTIQGEGNMADKKEKVAIDEDKRKIIDEIGGILKDEGLDDEIIRTVIGKAEKIAYNKSEAGDDGEEVEEEFIDEEEENVNKKPAKDKCGKDEEKDKEEEEKKKVVKAFAQKEKLGKEVEDALGTFDHSEMTELEIAKYACDKLDLEVEKGQEISAVKGYLKGLAKAPKATFGYKTVAADSGIQKEDAEFEKFVNKGE